MTQHSITSTPSFNARLMKSEIRRALLMAVVWAMMAAMYIGRRALGCVVMSSDALFASVTVLLGAAIFFEFLCVSMCRNWLRRGVFPRWYAHGSATLELAVVVGALVLMQAFSPRGTIAALSGPMLLALPLVTVMSILRLRPIVCVGVGFTGAAAHLGMSAYAVGAEDIPPDLVPVLFGYGVMLGLTTVAAALVAMHARRALVESVHDALVADRTERALAVVERDLTVAQEIQAGLMPSTTPTIAGYDIAGFARPAAKTGGDYYDWQPMADGRLVVAMADVTGHGIGPALVMAVCRSYARATAPTAPDPSALLASINALIHDDLSRTGRFITMAIAILSPDGRAELASAGHGPTLIYRAATNEVQVFGGDGLPLGVLADEQYTPHQTLSLARDDVLLLLTDGFMEWRGGADHTMFGLERLRAAFASVAKGDANAIIRELDAIVQSYASGAPQEDDTTAVAIKRVT